jgi:hypothetical protein
VGSLYIKIIIPTYSRRPPLTEKGAIFEDIDIFTALFPKA